MVQFGEDDFLVLDMIDMLALDDLVLLHRFDGILGIRFRSEPADLDKTKGTYIFIRKLRVLVAYLLREFRRKRHRQG